MQKPKGKTHPFVLWAFLFFYCTQLTAQSSREVAVELSAVKTVNNHTELRWKADTGVIRYYIYKRPHIDSNWNLLDSTTPSVLKFVDTQSKQGTSIEYRVAKKKNNFAFLGNGYIKAGFDLPAAIDKGIVLLILDSNYILPVKTEISEFVDQLMHEGFQVIQKTVLRSDSVVNVKSWIFQQWQSDSLRLKCVLLMGHVPVPYSGDISPDGHADHRGAWPADNYYGSFQYNWTDITVNRTTASRTANSNSPGDGKFDVSRLNPVGTTWKNTKRYQLPVGRIDFYDMPAFGSDTILLKRYIIKNLAFRTKQVSFSPKGLVDDNFGYVAGEAFASGGYRNFSTFFGDSIIDGDYTGTGTGMKSTNYLWSYGCGGGSYTSCSGVSNSSAMAQDSLLNPFTMVFGSYFGDWDNQNNFLRSPIASKGWGLAAAWAGRPYWMMHEAALGAPLYQCVKSTYNCTNIYSVGSSGSGVHVALMGDPTLRVFPVANLCGVTAKADCAGNVTLKWQQSKDDADSLVIEYWSNNQWNPVITVSGTDTLSIQKLKPGKATLSIREKKLMKSASGTWWDLGARSTVDVFVNVDDFVSLSVNNTKLCYDDSFKLKANFNKNSKIMDWYRNGVGLSSSDTAVTIASMGQGDFKMVVMIQTDSGCVSKDSILLLAIPKDTVELNLKNDTTLTATSKQNAQIQWYRNDTLLLGVSSGNYSPKQTGVFRACTLTQDSCWACSDTLGFVKRYASGTWRLKDPLGFRIFPNPTKTDIAIFSSSGTRDLRWQIFDIQGVMLMSGVGADVCTSNLTIGCYYLVINEAYSVLFLKQ